MLLTPEKMRGAIQDGLVILTGPGHGGVRTLHDQEGCGVLGEERRRAARVTREYAARIANRHCGNCRRLGGA